MTTTGYPYIAQDRALAAEQARLDASEAWAEQNMSTDFHEHGEDARFIPADDVRDADVPTVRVVVSQDQCSTIIATYIPGQDGDAYGRDL